MQNDVVDDLYYFHQSPTTNIGISGKLENDNCIHRENHIFGSDIRNVDVELQL